MSSHHVDMMALQWSFGDNRQVLPRGYNSLSAASISSQRQLQRQQQQYAPGSPVADNVFMVGGSLVGGRDLQCRPRYNSANSCGSSACGQVDGHSDDGAQLFDVWEDFARNGRESDVTADEHFRQAFERRYGDGPRAITGRRNDVTSSESPLYHAFHRQQQQQPPTPFNAFSAATPQSLNPGRAGSFYVPSAAGLQQLQSAQAMQTSALMSYGKRRAAAHHNVNPAAAPGAQSYCVLCRKNGEPRAIYESHVLKDSDGRVRCPILRSYHCPYCGATGEQAHTVMYCPQAPPGTSVIKALKTARDSAGHRRVR